jgi:hypothetical protein
MQVASLPKEKHDFLFKFSKIVVSTPAWYYTLLKSFTLVLDCKSTYVCMNVCMYGQTASQPEKYIPIVN